MLQICQIKRDLCVIYEIVLLCWNNGRKANVVTYIKGITAHTHKYALLYSLLCFNWHVSIQTSHITVLFRFMRVFFCLLAAVFQYVLY